MIVELFGLPGVGKSTYARTRAEASEYTQVKFSKKGAVIWWCVVAAIIHPLIFFKHLTWCLMHNAHPFYVWNFFCVRIAKYTKASLATGTVLIDEGLLQNVLSFPSEKMDVAGMRRFLATVPTAHTVIVLTVGDAERQRRVQQRPYQSWRQKRNPAPDYDSIMKHNHDLFVAATSTQQQWSCIDNT